MNYSFEAELGKALDMMLQEEIDGIMNFELPEHVFSRRHERRMNKLLSEGVHTSFSTRKAFKILVAALLSVLLGIGVAASVSKEFRGILKDTVIKITNSINAYITHGEISSAFSLDEDTKTGISYTTKTEKSEFQNKNNVFSSESYEEKLWEPEYLPNEYSIVYEWYGDLSGSIGYTSNKDGHTIMFHYENIDSTLFVNNESIELEQFENEGVKYFAFVADEGSDKESMIVWYEDDFIFSLHSKSDIKILKKIAYSVKNIK